MKSPVILIILDGWGIAPPGPSNAIALASTPFMDKLKRTYPFMLLDAGGQTVGLPWGTIGNSEVGHLVIGAGRVIYQDLPRINQAILDKSFFNNGAFLKAINHTKDNDSSLHLLGLVSGAGGHSYDKHLYSLLEMAKQNNLKNVFIHVILDGRDSPYNSGLGFVRELSEEIKRIGLGKIATVSGRYFAMDRDKHWDRTEKAYRVMTEGKADYYYNDPIEAIKDRYDKKNYDEDFTPIVITDNNSKPIAKISDNDSVIMFNFRPDRARQITRSFAVKNFDGFERLLINNLCFVTMTQYDIDLPVDAAFPSDILNDSLSEVISKAGLFQLHVAETEKYAHITYFLGGGVEKSWPNQDNILIPSLRVSSYDQRPEMSARKITAEIIEAVEVEKYDFIAVNFANADMVGHTGNLEATIKAVEILDKCLQNIITLILKFDGKVLITADHGNAEQMADEDGEIDKEHSDNPVSLNIVAREFKNTQFSETGKIAGALYDVAPTIIDILGLSKPETMTGKSLLTYLDSPMKISHTSPKKQKAEKSFKHKLRQFFKKL